MRADLRHLQQPPLRPMKNAAGTSSRLPRAVTAAAAGTKLPKEPISGSDTNAPGDQAYPISTFTWLLVKKDNKDGTKAKLIRDFLTWMITPEAQAMAADLHYAPLPGPVVSLVQARLPTLKAGGKSIATR